MARSSLSILREIRNMTQEELAKESNTTTRTIVSYENDVNKLRSASYKRLKSIADALDVSVDDIFLEIISDFLKLPNHSKILKGDE